VDAKFVRARLTPPLDLSSRAAAFHNQELNQAAKPYSLKMNNFGV